jgi:hypothetical protein
MADCNTLKAGYWYDGPGPISRQTIKSCKEGFYCATEGSLITVDIDTTAALGLIACPAGTSSTAVAYPDEGPKVINDCKRLLAGFEYSPATTPTIIAGADVKPCAADTYSGAERTIDTDTFAELLCTRCPEGTGVTAQGNDAEPGAKVVNDCKKVYEGYYYNGIGSGDISTTTVVPCPADKFCPGWPLTATNIVARGNAISPLSCPPGTQRVAGTAKPLTWWADNEAARAILTPNPASTDRSGANGAKTIADCNKLVAGWYYSGTNPISPTTVRECPEDKYCLTGGVLIAVPTATTVVAAGAAPATGVNTCPAGSGSAEGSDEINDCNRLKPAYYFTGNANVAGATPGPATIAQCPVKYYW